MNLSNVTMGARDWLVPAAVIVAILMLGVLWSYRAGPGRWSMRLLAGALKAAAVIALAACLVEPLFSALRPRPGANLFVIAADNSRSLQLRDNGQRQTRAARVTSDLDVESNWQTRLSQDFDVRRYVFDTRVRPVADFTGMNFDGNGSVLATALSTILGRFADRPVAGVMILTDGNGTDLEQAALPSLDGPPIYPVLVGATAPTSDIRLTRVSVSQTNFEASPVAIHAEATCMGYDGSTVIFQLQDEAGVELQRQSLKNTGGSTPLTHRFMLRPAESGIRFYRLQVFARQDEAHLEHPERASEATLENNRQLVMVDQGGGPYRVLYVGGRPNWEFKFLRRAIQEDEQVHLVGLIRIAKREPKFNFRGHLGESTNPMYRGFSNQEDEDKEQYDEPVLLRLGVREGGTELQDGFPKSAEDLFQYHAIILDDLEASYFTQDQMSLIQQFVSERGGGFLMLGGRDSFRSGKYDRTPIGELLPVYLDQPRGPLGGEGYRLGLTREGQLQPWTRLRSNERDEEKRLAGMPEFSTLNPVQAIKPGATVLAHVESSEGGKLPALVVQRFGKGRTGAMLVGDLWRWSLRRPDPANNDQGTAWRQTVRWLVADVSSRVNTEVRSVPGGGGEAIELVVRVLDEEYQPLDNAGVEVTIETPEGKRVELSASTSETIAGGYLARFAPRLPGAYRAQVVAEGPDGAELGRDEIGWATEPATEEFAELQPNREMLERLAQQSGGELLALDDLSSFASSLPNRKVPITQPWTYPLWHHWGVLAFALTCLAGEWGLRRWKGLP